MRRRGVTVLLVLALAGAAGGCSRRSKTLSEQVAVELQTTPQPPRVGPVALTLELKEGYFKPVTRAEIEVEANMTHPGMAPMFGHTQEIAPGRYRWQMEFTMPGDWVLLLHIKLPGGQRVEKQLEINDVRAP